MFFDAKEYHSSNKQVANILSSQQAEPVSQQVAKSADILADADAWGDDDIEIEAEMMQNNEDENGRGDEGVAQDQNSDIFVPPSSGSDPLQNSLRKNPNVAALHIALGDFEKGMELLHRQIAVINFEPLRNLFIDIYVMSKMKLQTLPHTQPIDFTLRLV